jgi:hypothetical protein
VGGLGCDFDFEVSTVEVFFMDASDTKREL